MNVNISDIKIGNRVRDELGDIKSLEQSIAKYGLIQPIVVNKDMKLIAGFRRLTACKNLGMTEVEVVTVDIDDNLHMLELEGEENINRKQLSQDEIEKIITMKMQYLKSNKGLNKVLFPFRKFFGWIAAFFRRIFTPRKATVKPPVRY